MSDEEEASFQAAGKESIREFLHLEMDLSVRCVDDIRIKSVFYPPSGAISRTLYAEFFSEEEAALVRGSSKNIKTVNGFRPKLVNYIPRSLVEKHKAVEGKAYSIRQSDLNQKTGKTNVSTRIWLTTEIELCVRRKGDMTPWSKIDKVIMNDLPAQAPNRSRLNADMLEKRRPITPFEPQTKVPKVTKEKKNSNKLQIQHFYDILEDNCQT